MLSTDSHNYEPHEWMTMLRKDWVDKEKKHAHVGVGMNTKRKKLHLPNK
jgi:hypothetical protein